MKICVALVLAIGACLPIHEKVYNDDIVKKSFDVDGPKGAAVPKLVVTSTPATLDITVTNIATCERVHKELVQRWRETKKTTNTWVHGTMYAIGVLTAVAGVGIIADNVNNTDPTLRTFPVGDTVEKGRDTGIGITSGGGAILLLALGSSIRAADSRTTVGIVERDASKQTIECEHAPASGLVLGIVFPNGASRSYVPIGTTDPQGRVSTSWGNLVAHVPSTATLDGQLVTGAADVIVATITRGGELTSLGPISAPPNPDPEQAWTATVAIDTIDGYRGFQARFASSPHAAEAEQRLRALVARDAQKELDAALAAEDLDRATKALAVLRGTADATVADAAKERVDKLATTIKLKHAKERLPKMLADAETATDPVAAVNEIKAAIEVVRTTDPDLAKTFEPQLGALRDRLVAKLVKDGKDAYTARDFTSGTTKFTAAATLAVDPKPIEKQRTAAFDAGIRAGQTAARELASKRQYTDAIAIIDPLIVAAPQNASLAADKTRWQAAQAQLERDEAARQARQAVADKSKADREAAQLAEQARLAKEKADRDEKARVDREKQQAKVDADKAARAKAEADRKERDEAARRAAEDKRVAAFNEKARKEAEAKAAVEEAKRKVEEAKRQAEEQKRKEAAAKLEAQIKKTAAPNPPSTVQFALPQRYATRNVLEKLPTPNGCQVSMTAYLAKPTGCKGDCPARTVSRATMACGTIKFVFVRDQATVWLTCDGEKQTCQDCVATGKSALAPVLETKETLEVVQGCKKP